MPRVPLSRRSKILLWVTGSIIVLFMVLSSLVGVYVNWLWFGSVGYSGVYSTVIWTRVVLFLAFGVLAAAIVVGNLMVAHRLRPAYRPMSAEQQNLERYWAMVEPRRRLVYLALGAITFLLAGLAGQSQWQVWQLWLHGGKFGTSDPLFHKDIGFYAWDLPAYRAMLGFGFTTIVFALIFSAVVHYLSGAIRLQTPGPKVSVAARRHLTVLAFVFVVLKAFAYWLDRYDLLFSSRSTFTGASYTDVHASLPARTILFWVALLIAAGLLASLWLNSALLPGVAFVSMLVISILISGIYPSVLQQVSVKPNASSKEAPYIKDNINATRQAYGIVSGTNVDYQTYTVNQHPPLSAVTTPNPTVNNIRVLDPNVLSPTFTNLQQLQSFYGFSTKLDVERYTIDGETKDYIVGVRELDQANLQGEQTNWINQYTAFTHGYGFVAAAASTDVTNNPSAFTESDIPPVGPLNLTQPEVYYGELMPAYSIVGASGTPRENNPSSKVTYEGGGGVSLGNPVTRLAFALQLKQTNLLLNSTASTKGARIIFDREPRQMVQKAAPFLKIDGDPYPIVDQQTGHIVWIVDGYTTMNNYPYSQRNSLSQLTNDSLSTTGRTAQQPSDSINYIRNSVKATVDAYTGKVTLYAWDRSDPVLAAWRSIFPSLVKPSGDMPAAIRQHVRYPEDLFNVQRSMIGVYHVSDPQVFYNQQEIWTVPTDPFATSGDQPPYYVLAGAPDSPSKAQFQLTSPMNVNNRQNLAAFITVDSDPGANFGKFTVLEVPKSVVTNGPEQIANILRSNAVISKDLSLFNQAGGDSGVVHGNLLTLPIGKSFLYVEPLYVQGVGGKGQFPRLTRVLAVYGDKTGYAPTLSGALQNLGDSYVGRDLSDSVGNNTTSPSTSPSSSPTTSPSTGGTSSSPSSGSSSGSVTLNQLLTQLDAAYASLQSAYATGDPAKISQAQGTVLDLVKQISALQGSASPSPSPSASKSK